MFMVGILGNKNVCMWLIFFLFCCVILLMVGVNVNEDIVFNVDYICVFLMGKGIVLRFDIFFLKLVDNFIFMGIFLVFFSIELFVRFEKFICIWVVRLDNDIFK